MIAVKKDKHVEELRLQTLEQRNLYCLRGLKMPFQTVTLNLGLDSFPKHESWA